MLTRSAGSFLTSGQLTRLTCARIERLCALILCRPYALRLASNLQAEGDATTSSSWSSEDLRLLATASTGAAYLDI